MGLGSASKPGKHSWCQGRNWERKPFFSPHFIPASKNPILFSQLNLKPRVQRQGEEPANWPMSRIGRCSRAELGCRSLFVYTVPFGLSPIWVNELARHGCQSDGLMARWNSIWDGKAEHQKDTCTFCHSYSSASHTLSLCGPGSRSAELLSPKAG